MCVFLARVPLRPCDACAPSCLRFPLPLIRGGADVTPMLIPDAQSPCRSRWPPAVGELIFQYRFLVLSGTVFLVTIFFFFYLCQGRSFCLVPDSAHAASRRILTTCDSGRLSRPSLWRSGLALVRVLEATLFLSCAPRTASA